MVVVEGGDLREVARFVSEKLSSLDGVLSTATHFRLKTYKENGFLFESEASPERLAVAPWAAGALDPTPLQQLAQV